MLRGSTMSAQRLGAYQACALHGTNRCAVFGHPQWRMAGVSTGYMNKLSEYSAFATGERANMLFSTTAPSIGAQRGWSQSSTISLMGCRGHNSSQCRAAPTSTWSADNSSYTLKTKGVNGTVGNSRCLLMVGSTSFSICTVAEVQKCSPSQASLAISGHASSSASKISSTLPLDADSNSL
jgi:hypothetical protein